MSLYKVDFTSIPWETPLNGLRFKRMIHGDKQLRLVEYTKDMPPHWCEKGHIGYVLEGRMEIKFEGEVVIFNPGEGVFIPSGREHKHMGEALTDVVRIVFVEEYTA
ncbi:MAG: cupin domain-containing protein [Gemmatimonadota bacterium]|nr:cupin domain-containing protein [Gemmatimonadota bacterium]